MNDEFDSYADKAYRFISFEGLFSTLKSRSLRFTRVDEFNDPLDNSPYLMNLNWSEISKNGNDLARIASKTAFEMAFSSMYICCFTKTYTSKKSYLMWSHYGQSHSQVCFEIDFSKVDYCGKPSNVKYSKDLVSMRCSDFKDGQQGIYITTYKDKVWNYEKEVRLIFDLRNGNIDFEEIKIVADGKRLDVPFNPKIISKVIFGYNATEINELRTIQLFNKIGHSPIFEKMTIDSMTLKLKPENYMLRK